MQKPFLDALPVLNEIEAAGFEAYFVGGSVRDTILGRPIGDVDIATSALPEQIKKIFSRTVDVGIEHGTVLVLYKGGSYEVTTYRTETGYTDFRRPDEVRFVSSLKEDLMRRDFTINAMAMDRNGTVIDYFGGQEDIANKLIRTVGSPFERFSEDALRIMRAVRFLSQLGFDIEDKTLSSIVETAHLLSHIAVERKRAEFEKMIQGIGRVEGIKMVSDTGILEYLPGLGGRANELSKLATFSILSLRLNEMWALLLHFLAIEEKTAEGILREWKLPIKQIKEILKVLDYFRQRLDNDWDVLLLYQAGLDTISSVENLLHAIGRKANKEKWVRTYETLPIKSSKDMDISGGDLISWAGQSGGPWVKEQLALVEEAILLGRLMNRKDKIKEWLLNCNQK
ncbi:CCA tRNA nucleotidyltransferase [Bacillus sp. FJAT-27225]|uniref:CCA tRNA nucleotidyltransferase n=1 Tax=Bacillus sp. FJAT-27225 TaxID=1743144 RepID=UPI00080C2101|nr:CCA tRNA nucleotidyltransferase [Bacillus sp. FJAT-27225]OCA90908.1 CCA tRNA nucleotidyltransferase [Bacillus sp. FJAT-27225]